MASGFFMPVNMQENRNKKVSKSSCALQAFLFLLLLSLLLFLLLLFLHIVCIIVAFDAIDAVSYSVCRCAKVGQIHPEKVGGNESKPKKETQKKKNSKEYVWQPKKLSYRNWKNKRMYVHTSDEYALKCANVCVQQMKQ